MTAYSSWECAPFDMVTYVQDADSEVSDLCTGPDTLSELSYEPCDTQLIASLDWTPCESENTLEHNVPFYFPPFDVTGTGASDTPTYVDPRPFTCPITKCQRKYLYKRDLAHHMKRKHPTCVEEALTISRPRSNRLNKKFGCPHTDCPSGYMNQRDLKRHIKTKHAIEPSKKPEDPRFVVLNFDLDTVDTKPFKKPTLPSSYVLPQEGFFDFLCVPHLQTFDFRDYNPTASGKRHSL